MRIVRIIRQSIGFAIAACSMMSAGVFAAQPVVVQDNMTGASSSYPWKPFGGACLTAGDGSSSTIPACTATDTSVSPNVAHVGGYSGTLPDPLGNGALRLTNSANNESGAIISTRAFPVNAGIQATFTTVTYRGDSGGTGKLGADGISFFLMDAAKTPNIGSFGGSLGYSCSNSNSPYTGMIGAYVGLGIDEYGNFLNASDNTASGYGYQWGRIGLRGAGSVAWSALTAAYGINPNDSTKPYYPASLATTCANGGAYNSVAKTCNTAICSTGTAFNYTNGDCETPICSGGTLYVASDNKCETPNCTSGQYYQSSASACQTPGCGTGTYYQAGANACQAPSCTSGQYYRAGANACQTPSCGAGQYYQSGPNTCQTPSCSGTPGTYYQSGANACQTPTCGSGLTYQSGANACQALGCGTAGQYYQSGVNACQTPTCASGKYYQSGANACQTPTCTSGMYYQPGVNACQTPKCSKGTYNAGTNSCSSGGTLSWTGGTAPSWGSSSAPTSWTGNTARVWLGNTAPTWSGTAPATWSGTNTVSWGSDATPTWTGTTAPTWSGTAAPTFNGTSTGTLTYGGTATGTLTYGTVSNSVPNSVNAVKNTCSTGNLFNYSIPNNPSVAGSATLSNANNTAKILDYAPIPNAYKVLDSATQPLANESATNRTQAVPITYQLKITQAGLLSLNYSYNGGTYSPIITNQDITASNGALPAAGFYFGFAASTGGSRNVHEITCFQATSADQSSSSAAVNVQQTAKVDTGTQVYLAFYNPQYWSGQLTSQNLVVDTQGSMSISPTVNWDASCVLTGGNCNTTSAQNMTAQDSSSRNILTWNGSAGVPFQWSNLTTGTGGQQAVLDQGDTPPFNADRLNFLRGDRTNEINTSGVGKYRARFSVLGDIIDSTPTWVGPPSAPYTGAWSDALYPAAVHPENDAAAQTYPQFVASSAATRLNVVYTGSNDGMLHGFRSGSYDSAGTYVDNATTPNDGREVLAYVPGAVVQTIHNSTNSGLDYSSPQYAHNYFVDGTPTSDDVFYGGAWHTWLVGGLGPGGAAIYALDVTNPSLFSETNAGTLVKGEWTNSSITCANSTTCGSSLGQTYGVPQIRRFHNGRWGFIFGNGYNSATGTAGIFIAVLNPTSGVPTFYFLDTGYGPGKDPAGKNTNNGIYFATPADLDGDHITDYVYAGDLFGNVWRFDLTSDQPSQWAASSAPMFSTPAGQPITSKVMVASVPQTSGLPRVMVDFGTGQQIPQTITTAAQYASAQQSLYGIWDWNLSSWNLRSTAHFATLTAPQTVTISKLQQQTIQGTYNSTGTGTGSGLRTVSRNSVCWQGTTGCTTGQYGWYFPLATSSGVASPEQVIYSPIVAYGAFVVNTTIPANNSPTTCTASTATGWTMAIDPGTGGAFVNSFFGTSTQQFVTIQGQVVSGIALNAVGSPAVVTANNAPYLVNQTVSGVGTVNAINPTGGMHSRRLTWIQKR